MNYSLIVRPEAEAELADAFNWYEQQVKGLGNRFLAEIDSAIQSIMRNPLQFPIIYKDVRRALTKRFPYQMLYITNDMQITVIAIFHGMRNPCVWQNRN